MYSLLGTELELCGWDEDSKDVSEISCICKSSTTLSLIFNTAVGLTL